MSYQLTSPLSIIYTQISSQLSKFRTSICRPKFGLRTFCLSSEFTRCQQNVPWLRRSVAGLSPRRTGFDPNSVYVGFVVGKVTLEQAYLPVRRYSLSVSFHHRSILIHCYQLRHARTDYRTLVDTPAGFHFPHIHTYLRDHFPC
jgi:hypothetical protein